MTESWDPIAAVEPPAVEVKLFGRWNPDDVQVGDISLQVNLILYNILCIILGHMNWTLTERVWCLCVGCSDILS